MATFPSQFTFCKQRKKVRGIVHSGILCWVRNNRIAHFKELMYLSTKYQWKCILNYHAACLLEIERGHFVWGDSFQMLHSTTLAGGFLPSFRSQSSVSSSNVRTTPPNDIFAKVFSEVNVLFPVTIMAS